MAHGQVPRVQHAAGKQLARRLGVLVVLLAADVARKDNLANLLAVLGHVDQHALGLVGLDDAHGQRRQEAVALPRHVGEAFVFGEGVPRGQDVAARDGAVGFCEAVDVDGEQVEVGHLLKEVRGGRAGGDGDADGPREHHGVLVGAEERVDGGGCVEVRDGFLLEEFPDQGVVDLAQADVSAADGADRPGECPADGVEPGLLALA
jgi:hypothetical protein